MKQDNFDEVIMCTVYTVPVTVMTIIAFAVYGINELSVVFAIFDIAFVLASCIELLRWSKIRKSKQDTE